MGLLLGLLAVVLSIAWIGYLALTVTAFAEPNAERFLTWGVSTPAMLGFAVASFWAFERFAEIR